MAKLRQQLFDAEHGRCHVLATVLDAVGDPLFARDYSCADKAIPPAAVDSAIAAMAPRPGQPREQGSDPIALPGVCNA